MIDLSQHKLELDYPCNWKYKLVVRCEHDINCIVKEILKDRLHTISSSNQSKKGNFNSFTLDLEVLDEEDRKELYKLLGDHKDIKMVL